MPDTLTSCVVASAANDELRAGSSDQPLLRSGTVALVGAGPGDPELLTLRALRLLRCADVVLHDSLVSPAVLALLPATAWRIHVGKRAARHTLAQAQINTLLLRLARQGERVVRLKGGDPFMFGRGGEEVDYLAAAGVTCQVVPGITAPGGCAAYAGIPLTHRDCAATVVFASAHRKAEAQALDWPQLARADQTVVFFMGRRGLADICQQLVRHGLPRTWPAALIVSGTLPQQQVIRADLASLAQRAAALDSLGPGLVIVGEVVALQSKPGALHPQDGETRPVHKANCAAVSRSVVAHDGGEDRQQTEEQVV